ncbi:hypothetical protein [Collimonas sp. OK412]|uniref:hypothetical protein n=1 Tax=Collimonas sp. (strain OK412) TaxID=1801619 RepID=UPI0008DF8E86|nr:hypothetical protein [Collimonas sp. OK412]SFB76566.1 hypothetical protein SAMN04515619_101454 [Collimonas sp. OK412]
MSSPLIQRPNYFAGEALLTADFACEQQYHMDIQSFNNQSLYICGIASGLEVFWDAESSASQVEVSPGMAIDGLGRQIILLQPQVVRLANVVAGATYFLSISYNQVYADYSNETGVAGYKRIVEQPLIQYVRNLQQPAMNILLAVISFTTQGAINQLTYRSGNIERRYVGSTLGALNFVTEGAGVHRINLPDALAGFLGNADSDGYPSIRAKKESSGDQAYLEVDAPRSQFMGLLTTRNNLGVGNPQPLANLQVDAITFKGPGTLSSDGPLVTLSKTLAPYFEVGDVLISDPPVTTMSNGQTSFGLAQRRTIVGINPGSLQVTVDAAFNPVLQSISYTYVRSTLVRFAASSDSNLLRINVDGTVGLGMQAATSSGLAGAGPNALVITADRKVGIALTDRSPAAALDVNGKIQADDLNVRGQIQTGSMISSGPIQAQSFEGNGSKLQGLPILSYWTRETVGTPTSNLYYTEGNVGIRDKNPLASLSVGGGQSFIGKGQVTAISDNVLQGYQTAFLDEVTVGDTITVGMLVEQAGVIAEILSDTQLRLQEQLPLAVQDWAYSYQAPGADRKPGQGQISSNGSIITGKGSSFKSTAAVGGKIIIGRFDPKTSISQSSAVVTVASATALTLATPFAIDVIGSTYKYQAGSGPVTDGVGTITTKGVQVTGDKTDFSGYKAGDLLIIPPSIALPQTMFVQSVISQTELKLTLSDGKGKLTGNFPAAVSAYVVTPSLLGYFAANNANGVLPSSGPGIPPAMIVATNNIAATPNTVAINYRPEEIQNKYALQVKGDVNFSGSSVDVKDLHVETLTASKSITVKGDDTSDKLLDVGESGSSLLTVSRDNVTVGASSAPYQLETTGNVHASGNIVSDQKVQGASLAGAALQAAGTKVNADGSVQIIGDRVAFNQSNLTNNGTTFQQKASTDGYVMAVVGQPTWNADYCGSLAGVTTDGNGNQTSFAYATALAYQYSVQDGKKSAQTISIPVPGSFTLPVKKGETWTLTLTWVTTVGPAPDVEFYWIPLGPVPAALNAMAPAPAAALPGGGMAATLQSLRDDLAAGRISSSMQASAQQAIQNRVGDLTQILGDATHMSSNPSDREQFIRDLQKIVCAPGLPAQASTLPGFGQSLEDLIDTFGKVTAHDFSPAQRGLLAAGVRALVQINDNQANRRDLNLIKNNINLFLDNVQQVLQLQFGANEQRLLTRALVRLVGDGSGDADGS